MNLSVALLKYAFLCIAFYVYKQFVMVIMNKASLYR